MYDDLACSIYTSTKTCNYLIAGIFAQNMLAPFYIKYKNILQLVTTEIYV
jgi:hypothetical protein